MRYILSSNVTKYIVQLNHKKKLEKMLAEKRQSIKVAGYFRANGYIITSSRDFAT